MGRRATAPDPGVDAAVDAVLDAPTPTETDVRIDVMTLCAAAHDVVPEFDLDQLDFNNAPMTELDWAVECINNALRSKV